MPITGDAKGVASSMKKTYGKDWEKVFYSTANKQGRKAETWEKKKTKKLAGLLDQIPDGGALKQNEIPGGRADGKSNQQFPQDQLHEGQEVEAEEHGGTPGIAADIARDHLTEDPRYYDHLEKMEQLGSRIMKVSALVPQRAPSVAPGIEGPLKLVDQQTGAPPAAAAAAPQAGKPTTPQVAATQPPGAPPQQQPQVPGAPAAAPMPKAAAEIRARLAAVRVRAIMAEV